MRPCGRNAAAGLRTAQARGAYGESGCASSSFDDSDVGLSMRLGAMRCEPQWLCSDQTFEAADHRPNPPEGGARFEIDRLHAYLAEQRGAASRGRHPLREQHASRPGLAPLEEL